MVYLLKDYADEQVDYVLIMSPKNEEIFNQAVRYKDEIRTNNENVEETDIELIRKYLDKYNIYYELITTFKTIYYQEETLYEKIKRYFKGKNTN